MKKYTLLASIAAIGGAVAFQGTYVNLQPATPGSVQTGHLNITGTARSGSMVGYSNTPTGIAYGGDFRSVSNQGRGVLGNASSPTGVTYGGLFQSASTTGRGIAGISTATSGFAAGGFFTANSPDGKGVQGSSNAVTGLSYGVYGRALSPAGYGVYAEGNMAASGIISGNGSGLANVNAAQLGGFDSTAFGKIVGANTWTGQNVFSNASNSFTGNGSGLSFMNASNLTFGTLADARLSSNVPLKNTANAFTGSNSFSLPLLLANGTGAAPALSFTGDPDTGLFSNGPGILAFSTNGTNRMFLDNNGRLGINEASPTARFQVVDDNSSGSGTVNISNGTPTVGPSPARWGVVARVGGGSSNSTAVGGFSTSQGGDSVGVRGVASGSSTNYGVYGSASLGSTNYGVYGIATLGTSNFAGYFNGYLYATSSNAGIKAFMIDHPMDPANKVLMHSSIESDERKNIYDGIVTTDSNGFATVTMPSWFEALNEDFRYQLTVNGDESSDFVLVKVAHKLRNGKFKVRTSAPNVEVNWMITGRRHDPTSNYYPLEVEREKSRDEKGKYYVPEAHGKDTSLGIGYLPQESAARHAKKSG